GQIQDPRAVEPLIKALGDEDKFVREVAANSLRSIAESTKDLLTLIRLSRIKKEGISLVAIERLGQVGDTKVVKRLQFIAKNEIKHNKQERQTAKQALEQIKKRVSPEEWEKVTAKRHFNFKKYFKIGGIALGAGVVLWGIACLVSYAIGRIIFRNASRQREQGQDKGTKLRSIIPFLPLAFINSPTPIDTNFIYLFLAIVGAVGLFYVLRKIILVYRISSSQKRNVLPLVKTLKELVTLRETEKVNRAIVLRVLRIGVKSRAGGFALWMTGGILITAGLILFGQMQTYISIIILLAAVSAIGFGIQSERGIRFIISSIELLRVTFRVLVYPANYIRMMGEYSRSSARSPEHYYLLKRFKKEQGERMFDEIEALANKQFGQDARWQVMDGVIRLAYEMLL
ncbi:MAG: hypothetical protein AAB267_06470, partial [Candidatus Desantisbacteria bacterium]